MDLCLIQKLEKILIVESNDDIRFLNQMILESNFKVEVLTAGGEKEAKKILDECSALKVIISGLRLSDGSGDEIFKSVVEKKLNCSFILYGNG